ncbi:uncharacterized protein LOC128202699 [Mya arenaria]|uniref:uncharacterized protein LOC128202699 n=1 Tax=Mya arenaria TaxID=6604 RepID=UPI0022E75659|nr:uncharacterized protein LOC128202699 [Mya arenaria]
MAHRRKSSHPVCKTRRNLEFLQDEEDDDENQERSSGSGDHDNKAVVMETGGGEGQQIVLPSDLFKDFEAVRNKTKMDTTDLMRRLLKDYQSISSSGDKPLTVTTSESHIDHDIHSNDSLATSVTSIAKDVSLATTRVDTDDDQYQGLDLSVGTRKITSQLFDTKSLELGTFDQPLDLTCTKPEGMKEELRPDSPSSTQMDMNGSGNEFNYVYVYPGLYPPGSVVNSVDDLDTHPEMTSPVPELVSPGKIPSPDTLSRAQYLATTEALESAYGAAERLAKNQVSTTSCIYEKMASPQIKKEMGELEIRPKPYTQSSPNTYAQRAPPTKSAKSRDSKKSTEMKVISEHTSAGVYTSVMKLPWSRRTRTKKPKHKIKLEDTLIPQFMLEQQYQEEGELPSPKSSSGSYENSPSHCSMQVSSHSTVGSPATSQSVMMVYPNSGGSAYGKPIRRRGRPPKLPMLAKLLHEQQGGKREKAGKEGETMQAHISHQVQANGGALVYNSDGQITSAYGNGLTMQHQLPSTQPQHQQEQPSFSPSPNSASPLETAMITSALSMPQLQPAVSIPNMAQAQFLGQIPLSQLMGGPIQFLGQFPANALPFPPGQSMTAFHMPIPTGEPQDQTGTGSNDGQKPENIPSNLPPGFQYAFQPMFIPHPVSLPQQPPPPSTPPTIAAGELTVESSSEASFSATEDTSSIMSSATTHVMKMANSSTVSTMSTTSISNTDSGAIYQEMILSSKSLVDVKRRKRQTAIQMLKSKSGDNNFLCTSFRIRPRLVAQAQAQKERQAAQGEREEDEDVGAELIAGQKNLIVPQNDVKCHFGENNTSDCDVDFESIQIKKEVDPDDDVYQEIEELEINNIVEHKDENNVKDVKPTVFSKRLALKGSQKRKAKFYGSRIVNEKSEKPTPRELVVGGVANINNSAANDMFQEMFNCKVCNNIISVDEMEAHSLDHLKSTTYQCRKCGKGYGESAVGRSTNPVCETCQEPLVTVAALSDNGIKSALSCDECTETFKSLPEFYEHKTAHRNDPNSQGGFECDFCGKVYQYYHALQFHRRTHRERRVPCMEKSCDMKFRSRKEMENHYEAKHPDKKEYFHCVYDGCTKRFLKNFHLQEHIRVKHYNIKAFQCPWPGCTKEFAAQRHLKIHLLIHRDEKPMKCDHCEYRCRQRSAMNWHMRKHPDVPYKYKRAVKSPSASKSESE